MAKRNNFEATNQAMFFDWLGLALPKIRKLTFAVPNGGYRHPREASNLKRQGVTAGVFDIFLAFSSHGYNGLFIEMKHGKNKLTDYQEVFQTNVTNAGFLCVVCYNFTEAKDAVEKYLGG